MEAVNELVNISASGGVGRHGGNAARIFLAEYNDLEQYLTPAEKLFFKPSVIGAMEVVRTCRDYHNSADSATRYVVNEMGNMYAEIRLRGSILYDDTIGAGRDSANIRTDIYFTRARYRLEFLRQLGLISRNNSIRLNMIGSRLKEAVPLLPPTFKALCNQLSIDSKSDESGYGHAVNGVIKSLDDVVKAAKDYVARSNKIDFFEDTDEMDLDRHTLLYSIEEQLQEFKPTKYLTNALNSILVALVDSSITDLDEEVSKLRKDLNTRVGQPCDKEVEVLILCAKLYGSILAEGAENVDIARVRHKLSLLQSCNVFSGKDRYWLRSEIIKLFGAPQKHNSECRRLFLVASNNMPKDVTPYQAIRNTLRLDLEHLSKTLIEE